MKRREFITLVGGTAAASCPIAARAHPPTMPVIGFLHPSAPDAYRPRAFRQGLKDAGLIDGENSAIEYRWADNQLDRLPTLARELVQRPVAVIATAGFPSVFAAKAATTTIPTVFLVGEDPVVRGLVTSLARPGGNLTGINFLAVELAAKRLELLLELVPGATRIAVLVNPTNAASTEATLRDVGAVARAKGLQVQVFNVSTIREIDAAFVTLVSERPHALFIANDPFLIDRRVQLAQLAAHHSIPATHQDTLYAKVWRADELRCQRGGCVASSRRLHRPHPQGRETCGFASRAVDQVRVGHQRLDRQNARSHRATDVALRRRRGHRMRRREFITLLGGAAAAWPLAPHAQQPAMPVVGFLHTGSPDGFTDFLRGFRQGLKDSGYVEGENVAIEYRWAEDQMGRLPALAAELVRRRVAVIAAPTNAAALAAKAATATVPIVFLVGDDPVKLGLVVSVARPGGNLTGVNFLNAELSTKRLEYLRTLVPGTERLAVLVNPANAPTTESTLRDLEPAARAMGLRIQVLNTGTSREIDAAFATFVNERPDAIFVSLGPFLPVGVSNWFIGRRAMPFPPLTRVVSLPKSAGL
jgi:putative ABC transport system substrate-binding protein